MNQTISIGDTIQVLTGEHRGKTGNVRALGHHRDGNLAVRMDDDRADISRELVRFHSENVRVISTEEIDRAKRVLLDAGWTLTPPIRSALPAEDEDRDLSAPRWNIGYRIYRLDEWAMWWHSGDTGHRTEEEAREEFYGLLKDPYWLAARDLRLLDADGNIVDEHVRDTIHDKRLR